MEDEIEFIEESVGEELVELGTRDMLASGSANNLEFEHIQEKTDPKQKQAE